MKNRGLSQAHGGDTFIPALCRRQNRKERFACIISKKSQLCCILVVSCPFYNAIKSLTINCTHLNNLANPNLKLKRSSTITTRIKFLPVGCKGAADVFRESLSVTAHINLARSTDIIVAKLTYLLVVHRQVVSRLGKCLAIPRRNNFFGDSHYCSCLLLFFVDCCCCLLLLLQLVRLCIIRRADTLKSWNEKGNGTPNLNPEFRLVIM